MKTISVIPGDGIGIEIASAVIKIFTAAGADLEYKMVEAGEKSFQRGIETGVPPETIEKIKETRVVLKGPLSTSIGFGEKSANVTLRKMFETFANIRPCRNVPGIKTPFSSRKIDFVIVRENLEDLYAGIEYMPTRNTMQAFKMISTLGSEKVIRYAFELARAEGRKRVTCGHKANILKFTEGHFKNIFEQVAKEYPDIEANTLIVDDAAHKMVIRPEMLDVLVLTNMNGDILSDEASGLIGGLGTAPSANIGKDVAIFESVHGSAPDIAGKGIANPTALLRSGIMLLNHINEFEVAHKIEKALYLTLDQGRMTGDLGGKLNTVEFTNAIIENLGKECETIVRKTHVVKMPDKSTTLIQVKKETLLGADIYVSSDRTPKELAELINNTMRNEKLALKLISNRGSMVWPEKIGDIDLVDLYCCRFMAINDKIDLENIDILNLLKDLDWVEVVKLKKFDNTLSFTKAQGEG
jgi:isocitrate dehydrogenase